VAKCDDNGLDAGRETNSDLNDRPNIERGEKANLRLDADAGGDGSPDGCDELNLDVDNNVGGDVNVRYAALSGRSPMSII
jgi:hypothetical protein